MNFDYSYRAFLISCLLVGNLILLLVSVKLTKKVPVEEEVVPVEYAETLPDDEVALTSREKIKIETNTAYNEAEKFISEMEDRRNENDQNSEEIADAELTENTASADSYALTNAKEKLSQVKAKLNNTSRSSKLATANKSVNKKTTIRYDLEQRKALYLPNPVYTCETGGKIVISIEVSELGKILKAQYNKELSTTTNGCLIDSALEYSRKAKFTTAVGIKKQKGTITYLFPGQD